ncbi:MAG: type III pantothenate kinase [Chloroflexi bacterium]|nr:type III pantothenate kinase [Chloroflexota bacterium]
MANLLAVDVGNSNVTLGVFEGDRLVATWRFATDVRRTADEHNLLLQGLLRSKGVDPASLPAAVMCSVVPPLTGAIETALEALLGVAPMVVGPGTRTGIKVNYNRPQDVGTDRIADAVAAFRMYGGPCILVDLGTATVFDAISADAEYLGGAIAPGMTLAAEALYQGTSQLRRVDLQAPEFAIGRNTTDAMRSGLVFGYVGLVEGMVRRFAAELSPDDPSACKVIGTGGLARIVAAQSDVFQDVNEDLTLIGLRILHELNGGD